MNDREQEGRRAAQMFLIALELAPNKDVARLICTVGPVALLAQGGQDGRLHVSTLRKTMAIEAVEHVEAGGSAVQQLCKVAQIN